MLGLGGGGGVGSGSMGGPLRVLQMHCAPGRHPPELVDTYWPAVTSSYWKKRPELLLPTNQWQNGGKVAYPPELSRPARL